jgi:tRNA pseudouridine38-40 synthase
LRYRALVEYDGAAYHGFQRQREGEPTIQAALEEALEALFGRFLPVTGAGRTDSGVHALGQIITFVADWPHGLAALQRALNANLPADIAILQLEGSSPTFHPRFDARRRSYEYHIYNAPVRSPIRRATSWYVRRPLAIERMNEAAARLLGRHDFATFGQPPQGENSVREVYRAGWEPRVGLLVFSIEANAFLYRMVRSVVGSLKLVGDGTWTVDEFVAAFQACDRSRCGTVAPPHGLYLVSVLYET